MVKVVKMEKQYAVRYYIKEEYAAYINANNKKEALKIFNSKKPLYDIGLLEVKKYKPYLIEKVEE